MVKSQKPRLTLVVDPRFSGGTSSAVAREIHTLAPHCQLSVVAITSQLFRGKTIHPLIKQACFETQTPLTWDPATAAGDIIVLHNPSFLKFNPTLETRFVCDRLFVVCHENFLRADGSEGFDVAHCLSLISDQTLARQRYLAPISGWNRQCVVEWYQDRETNWSIAPSDWTNICDFDMIPPSEKPRDRRGRLSRQGAEKFPPMQNLQECFPESCETVRILGADSIMFLECPKHWELLPFGSEDVGSFLETIDFFIYYTHPLWQESFGRVIAEAIAAGKVVITNHATAQTFGNGVIAGDTSEVNKIISQMLADPKLYHEQVKKGQRAIEEFSADAFLRRFFQLLNRTTAPLIEPENPENLYAFL